jgi:Arc/MetJ family transcription regulator
MTREITMIRTTVKLDEGLLNEAQRVTGLTQRAALIQEGLKALIARESAKRLVRLGGSEPQIEETTKPKRRSPPAAVAGKVEILGNIVAPIVDEDDWECLK